LACLYCGKEIGPFRILRDTEFCCSAHRQGYRARLGKALNRISAHQPPPAPVAAFIPYKPFPGNNRTPSQAWTLERFRPELQLLHTWPLSVVPLPRERAAPLPSLQPFPLEQADFSIHPQSWFGGVAVRRPRMELEVENPLKDFEPEAGRDPAAAGPVRLDVAAANWMPDARSNNPSWSDAAWTAPAVRLPNSSRGPARVGSLKLCAATKGLLAEAVEAFLPPGPEPQMLAYPTGAVGPRRWTLHAAEWVVVADLANSAAAPAAEAVESLLPPPAEPQIARWPAALPPLTLAPTDWVVATAVAEPAAAPAAEAVESLLPPPAEPQIARWPAALPPLTLAPTDWVVATAVAEPVAAPAAEAVESLLPPPAEPRIAAWPVVAAALPRLSLDPAAWVLSVDLAQFVAGPAAEAVESLLPSPAEPQIATWPAAAAALPRLLLDPTDWVLEATIAEPAAAPAAEAVESFLPPAAEPQIITWPAAATLRLPELTLIAAEPEPVEEFIPPLVVADASESWMPGPPACEAVRDVIPTFAGELPAPTTLAAPALTAFLALEQPMIRWAGDLRQSATAEPVVSYVAPHLEPALPVTFAVSMPAAGALKRATGRHPQNLAAPAAERYVEAAEPSSDSPVIAASSDESGRWPQVLRFPALAVEHATGNRAAPFQSGDPSAAEPAAAEPNPGSAILQPDPASIQAPASPVAALRCGFPLAKPAVADFVCQRTPMAPIKPLEPITPPIHVHAPKFVVRPIFERIEEYVAPPKPVEKTPAFAEIFAISKAGRRHSSSSSQTGLFSAGKLIAASLIVGLSMWFGAGSVKISRQLLAINTTIHGMGSNTSPRMDSSPSPATSFPSPRYSVAQSPDGPIAKVRRAIQRRASVELTDTFRRMEAWGANAMTLPAGWTRHPDGYVRTGQLALYRPAQTFTDYRFEFFGEIEKKSMSWAVRARDTENYYAMKMTVIEPGLRPVIAVMHYPVVAGKKGQRVETPLSIMMHNNEPYHVAVDVKGNRVVTSIEGQEVDSWTDDTLKVGGIGFFSEVGESARLYWMRVSKNQDWLGRVCAYLSNGSGTDSAELWRNEIPRAPAQPSQPAPPTAVDVTLAAAEETEEFSHIGPQRARILKYGRTELCRS